MRLSDLDEVLEIERHVFRSAWSRELLIEELEREWARIDVVRDRGVGPVLAFVNYWIVRDEIHILNIATSPPERRKGHAAQLLQHVVKLARQETCREITLEVRRSNEAAQGLYARFGFRPVGVRPRYYADNDEDAIVMLLAIS
jgi:ribosomal-protein-alanine N-acetyltransferase